LTSVAMDKDIKNKFKTAWWMNVLASALVPALYIIESFLWLKKCIGSRKKSMVDQERYY